MLDHLFIDLKSENGKLLSVAAIRTDLNGTVQKAYEDERVSNASISLKSLIEETIPSTTRYVVVAFNADKVRQLYAEQNAPKELLLRSWICITQMAWPLTMSGLITLRSSAALADHFGIEATDAGTSHGDAMLAKDVYWQMIRRYTSAMKAEGFVRRQGGELLEEVRKYIGI